MKTTKNSTDSKMPFPIYKDNSGRDNDSDHSGSDTDNDSTVPTVEKENKHDKPKREADPDTTGIDTESDKTKPNNK